MEEDTAVSQKVVCDYMRVCGGGMKVPLAKELLNECTAARSQYRVQLKGERDQKQKMEQMVK